MAANTTFNVGYNRTVIITARQRVGNRSNVRRRPRYRITAEVPKNERRKLSVFVAWPNNPMNAVKATEAAVDIPTAELVSEFQQDIGSPVASS